MSSDGERSSSQSPVKAVKPKKTAPATKSVSTINIVKEALQTTEERNGLTLASLRSYATSKYPEVAALNGFKGRLRKAILKGLETEVLVRPAKSKECTGVSGRFKLAKPKKVAKPEKRARSRSASPAKKSGEKSSKPAKVAKPRARSKSPSAGKAKALSKTGATKKKAAASPKKAAPKKTAAEKPKKSPAAAKKSPAKKKSPAAAKKKSPAAARKSPVAAKKSPAKKAKKSPAPKSPKPAKKPAKKPKTAA